MVGSKVIIFLPAYVAGIRTAATFLGFQRILDDHELLLQESKPVYAHQWCYTKLRLVEKQRRRKPNMPPAKGRIWSEEMEMVRNGLLHQSDPEDLATLDAMEEHVPDEQLPESPPLNEQEPGTIPGVLKHTHISQDPFLQQATPEAMAHKDKYAFRAMKKELFLMLKDVIKAVEKSDSWRYVEGLRDDIRDLKEKWNIPIVFERRCYKVPRHTVLDFKDDDLEADNPAETPDDASNTAFSVTPDDPLSQLVRETVGESSVKQRKGGGKMKASKNISRVPERLMTATKTKQRSSLTKSEPQMLHERNSSLPQTLQLEKFNESLIHVPNPPTDVYGEPSMHEDLDNQVEEEHEMTDKKLVLFGRSYAE